MRSSFVLNLEFSYIFVLILMSPIRVWHYITYNEVDCSEGLRLRVQSLHYRELWGRERSKKLWEHQTKVSRVLRTKCANFWLRAKVRPKLMSKTKVWNSKFYDIFLNEIVFSERMEYKNCSHIDDQTILFPLLLLLLLIILESTAVHYIRTFLFCFS